MSRTAFDNTVAGDEANRLAFVWLSQPNVDACYLQWNKHLKSYNFFGGHVDEGEDFYTAVCRELAEELAASSDGQREALERYGLTLAPDAAFQAELAHVCQRMPTTPAVREPALSFYSLRYAANVTRDVALFNLSLSAHDLHILTRLQLMSQFVPSPALAQALNMPAGGVPIVKAFSRRELADYGRQAKYNPFITWATALLVA